MSNRIESLDSLRGIAAFIVVIFHCLLSYVIFYEANYNFEFSNLLVELLTVTPLHTVWAGKEAVLLFFVLSGFVLMIPFTNGRRPRYSSYMIKRICRIYVPYIVVMFISILLTTLFWEYRDIQGLSSTYNNRWDHEVSLKSILAYIAMFNFDTSNVNGVVWTLFIEMKISLILPLFLFLITKLDWKKGLIVSITINVILQVIFAYGVQNINFTPLQAIFVFFNDSIKYLYYFIIGAVLAKQRNEIIKYESMSITSKYLILALALILINSKWVSYLTSYRVELFENIVTSLGLSVLFFVILSTKSIDKFLSEKPLVYLGKISFSLYLVHIPVLMLLTVFLSKIIPVWLTFCLIPVVSILVAHFSYKWIEKPAMDMGRAIAKKSEGIITKSKAA